MLGYNVIFPQKNHENNHLFMKFCPLKFGATRYLFTTCTLLHAINYGIAWYCYA